MHAIQVRSSTVFALLATAASLVAAPAAWGAIVPVSQSRSVTANTTARGGTFVSPVSDSATDSTAAAGAFARSLSTHAFSKDPDWVSPILQSEAFAAASTNSEITPLAIFGSADVSARIINVSGSARGYARAEVLSQFQLDAPAEVTFTARVQHHAAPHGGDFSAYALGLSLTGWPFDPSNEPPSMWPINWTAADARVGTFTNATVDQTFSLTRTLDAGLTYTLRTYIEVDVPIHSSLDYDYRHTASMTFAFSVPAPTTAVAAPLLFPLLTRRSGRR